jgi:hypothetical protein
MDDGYLYATCTETLQHAMEHIVKMFTRMGLRMNANKTKAMICTPGQLYTRISSPAYQRLIGSIRNTLSGSFLVITGKYAIFLDFSRNMLIFRIFLCPKNPDFADNLVSGIFMKNFCLPR